MRKTETALNGEARRKVLRGVNAVYNAVRLSMGPEGASALIHRAFNRGSRITNDGVTIAKCIEPKDEFENLVAVSFKEAAAKTGERVGDGTTTTTVIAGNLINNAPVKDDSKTGLQIRGLESAGTGVISLKKHLLGAIPKIKEAIAKVTKKIETKEDLFKIADVSLAGNKEVAEIISDMIWKTGVEGFITLGDGFAGKIETELIEGARFPMKIAAPVFLNNPARFEMVAEDCEVIVTNYGIDSIADFASFWNALQVNKLLIFAPSFSEDVLIQMVKLMSPRPTPNGGAVPSGIKIFPVKTPSLRTDQYDDLALVCDAQFIDKNKGNKLKEIKKYDLGFVEKCTVKSVEDKEDAVILGGRGASQTVKLGENDIKFNKIKERVETLKGQLDKTKMPEHKKLLEKRIASLCSVGGLIRVGAPTEAEALPLKHKIEDALFATQAALKYGYVKGGGLCLKEIGEELFADDELIKNALSAPYNQIQENVGGSLDIGDDIIDPAKAVELEVEVGFGVAANLITCKIIIPEFDEHDPRDGYRLVADSILTGIRMWGKQQGLLKDGLDEADAERLARQEHLMSLEND